MSTIEQFQRIDSACIAFEHNWSPMSPLNEQSLLRLAREHNVLRVEDLLVELLLVQWQQTQALDATFQPEHSRANWTNYPEAFESALQEYQTRRKLASRQSRSRGQTQIADGVLLGPYQICGRIGSGGMGDVYAAEDTRLGRKVAIKILASHLTQNLAFVKRFAREAATVARLSHPNIVTLFDLGEVEVSGQSISFVVMEFLEGETIREHMEHERMSVQRAVQVAIEIAAALEASHRQTVVHRDIKPENIFLTDDGRVKVLDFGLARLGEEVPVERECSTGGGALTQVGTVLGTTGYMAPEQIRGEAAVESGDLFALTSVLFEMLFGRRAFPGDSRADIASATLRDDPLQQLDDQVRDQLPPALLELLDLGLQKQVENRIQSAHEYSRRLTVIATDIANSQRVTANHQVTMTYPGSAVALISWPSPRWLTPALFALIMVVGIAINQAKSTPAAIAASQSQTIAVLPFSCSPDTAGSAVSRTLTVNLTDALAGDKVLCVRPYSTVSTWNWNTESNLFDDPRIQRLKADLLVTGQVTQEGSDFCVRIELINAAKGRLVWSRSYTIPQTEVASLPRSIGHDVIRQVDGHSLLPLDPSSLACGR